jgi:hypothetical protein
MDSKARRQLAMAAALRSTTTSRGLPCRSSAAPTAPTSPTGPAGLAALRVPRVGVGPGRGVLDGGAPDAGDVLADGRRGRPQRRAEAAVPRPGRRGELRDRAARVPDGGPARLPPAAAGQPPGVPGAARGVGCRDARRGRVARALPGAAAAAGQRAVQGVAVQAPHRRQGAAQQPQTPVQASVAVV